MASSYAEGVVFERLGGWAVLELCCKRLRVGFEIPTLSETVVRRLDSSSLQLGNAMHEASIGMDAAADVLSQAVRQPYAYLAVGLCA